MAVVVIIVVEVMIMLLIRRIMMRTHIPKHKAAARGQPTVGQVALQPHVAVDLCL